MIYFYLVTKTNFGPQKQLIRMIQPHPTFRWDKDWIKEIEPLAALYGTDPKSSTHVFVSRSKTV